VLKRRIAMKFKATTLFLGLCFVLSVVAVNIPAYARSTTAFNSFHAQSATVFAEDPYLCLTEDNGAVVNNCSYDVNLLFDLQIDRIGEKTIKVQDYWKTTSDFVQFGCTSYVYTGTEGSSLMGTSLTFTGPKMALDTKDKVPAVGDSMTVICWHVPPGEGVANLNWNQ
jgi:hypothetical protein